MKDGAEIATSAPEGRARASGPPWRTNLVLFVATAASVLLTGVLSAPHAGEEPATFLQLFTNISPAALVHGAEFAGTLMTILVAHELGHYVAARLHKVDASLPFFLPMPLLSPFGTMGAVIRMRGAIPTRRALLDIGAAGPLAGLVFALPLYAWGVSRSYFVPASADDLIHLGESVLTKSLDYAFAPATPEGMLLVYSPIAFGAWGGLFVTMINLLPVSQLDGGHVAYALFGPKQDRYAQIVHRAMLVFFCVVVVGHVARDVSAGRALTASLMGRHIGNGIFWLVWFQVLAVLGSLSSRRDDGGDEPPSAGSVSVRTRIVATLGLVVLASIAREHSSWLVVVAFFAGLGLLVAMEVRGGVLRRGQRLLDHPPTGSAPLDRARQVVAIVTLALFALLFMPEPFGI